MRIKTHALRRGASSTEAGSASPAAAELLVEMEGDEFTTDAAVPPLQRMRFRDVIWGDAVADRVQVEFFTHEKSFKERLQLYFVKNMRSSFRIRLFNVLIKVLSCCLYVYRVVHDSGIPPGHDWCPRCAEPNASREWADDGDVHYVALLWVERFYWLWGVQTVVAVISILETVVILYISYKGNILTLLFSTQLLLELFTSLPFIITVAVRRLRYLYIPVFLNCWLAKFALVAMLNDLHRATQRTHSAMEQQVLILLSTLTCLIFTGTCGIQHLQRASHSMRNQMTLFQSFYFIVVTFSTVGYGEFYPDYWLSQLFVVCLICVAFGLLPGQIEQLAHTLVERQREGGVYSKQRAHAERHVVLTVTLLQPAVILDFLNEFYAHPMLENFYVLLLSPSDLDSSMNMLLRVPVWSERVIYVKGTVLKDSDLARARVTEAEACFILTARNNNVDKTLADQHTILRSWAVKDYAPKCPQYVQIFRPENKMHVRHAEYVVCEDEFKYALLASNCICPGISTFITLLLHTSRGEEGQHSSEPWHKLYGKHSGNEIYHVLLGTSKFFGEYEGKTFTYASFHAHQKYGVSLVAVQRAKHGAMIQLNPGPRHVMKTTDICYYMSITKEELSAFVVGSQCHGMRSGTVANTVANIGTLALELQHTKSQPANKMLSYHSSLAKRVKKKHGSRKLKEMQSDESALLEVQPVGRKPSIAPVPDTFDLSSHVSSASDDEIDEDGICTVCGPGCIEQQFVKGFPPVTPYIGTSATLCHLNPRRVPPCCLQLTEDCEHCHLRNATQYDWPNEPIILAADLASKGLYNFIIPLRAHYRPVHDLKPIVIMLAQRPDCTFLDAISWFPLVYWMCGKIECLDSLLKAGIHIADHVVVVNKEWTGSENADDYLVDCNTIVSVQTIHRLFPRTRIITDLSHTSNMRFTQFNAKDLYALHQSKHEKNEYKRGSHIAYMFRLPFAAGTVFSASMLDTLIYQVFVKDYLIQFVRLLLGIDQAMGSGFLTSIRLSEEDMWIRNYGRLYQKLCSTEGDVPIGIYRTQRMDSSAVSNQVSLEIEHQMQEERNSSADDDDLLRRRFSCKYFVSERHEISNLVRCRMERLTLNAADYSYRTEARGSIPFVIINPSADLQLQPNDIIYIIKPCLSMQQDKRTPNPSRVLRRRQRKLTRSKSPDAKALKAQYETAERERRQRSVSSEGGNTATTSRLDMPQVKVDNENCTSVQFDEPPAVFDG